MTIRITKISGYHLRIVITAAALFTLTLAYIALCLVVLHRPDYLPSGSILQASLVGPPHWLVWGSGARPMFWGSTLAIAVVAAVGAKFRMLVLPCAGLCFLIWFGAGFLSVSL